jgi:hypothetical protein
LPQEWSVQGERKRKRLAIILCYKLRETHLRLSFQPVYKHFSKPAAVMATFVASGLLHEWLVLVLWSTPPVHLVGVIEKSAEAVEVVYGGSMVFFVWQAILILVESLVGNWEIFKTMGRILPAPVRTALIVCAGIPVRVFHLVCFPL